MYADVEPKDFINTVLKNCGVIREKSTHVINTEKGAGFMRKMDSIQSKNPLKVYFGDESPVVTSMFGKNYNQDEVLMNCSSKRSTTQFLKTLMPMDFDKIER